MSHAMGDQGFAQKLTSARISWVKVGGGDCMDMSRVATQAAMYTPHGC